MFKKIFYTQVLQEKMHTIFPLFCHTLWTLYQHFLRTWFFTWMFSLQWFRSDLLWLEVSWLLTLDSWLLNLTLESDSWLLTLDSWLLTLDSCFLTLDSWLMRQNTSLLTLDSLPLSPDSLLVCNRVLINFKRNDFLGFLKYFHQCFVKKVQFLHTPYKAFGELKFALERRRQGLFDIWIKKCFILVCL